MKTLAASVRRAGLVFLLAVLGLPATAAGQELGNGPVFLALPNTFPDVDARAVLMRERGRDIVVLKEADAHPETLEVALRVLERVRQNPAPDTGLGQLIPITGFVYRTPLDPQARSRLETALDRLRRRPVTEVGTLGPGRWMPLSPR